MKIELFFSESGILRGTFEDKYSVPHLKPVWAAPQSRPAAFLSFLNAKGEEMVLLEDPETELSAAAREAVQRELRQRNLTAQVTQVTQARQEYGATYWTVDTNRGLREFVTQNLSENAIWFGEDRLLLLDVEGNRFEIDSLDALDARSRMLVDSIL